MPLSQFSYAQSLLWIAAFIALFASSLSIANLIQVDFIHENPHRTRSDALFMMFISSIFMGVTSMIGVFLVFTLPQILQFASSNALSLKFGRPAYVYAAFLIPLTSVITWYCYDYLTPSDVGLAMNSGPDWSPNQHGLTIQRYLRVLAIQTPVTVFTLVYCYAATTYQSRKRMILGVMALALVLGGMWGIHMAEAPFN